MNLIAAKTIALVLMLLLTLLFGLLPIKVARLLRAEPASLDGSVKRNRKRQYDTIISCLLCFGGGVLLSTCFIHMLPEVRESSLLAIQDPNLSFFNDFPLAELIMCFGFFFTYFIEELVHGMVRKQRKRKEKQQLSVVSNLNMTAVDCMSQSKDAIITDCGKKVLPLTFHPFSSLDSVEEFSPPLSQRALPRTIMEEDLDRSEEATHSHGHYVPAAITSLRSLLVILALSFHSVFEGMAMGLQESVAGVWYLFLAVCVHKFVIALCVGLEISAKGCRMRTLMVYMCTFASMCPAGVGLAMLLTTSLFSDRSTHSMTLTFLQGTASGTLIYVTFFEILESERNKPVSGLLKLLATFVGFVLMCLLRGFIHEDHGSHLAHESLRADDHGHGLA